MANEASLNIEGSRAYQTGSQRSNEALERFEKSFSRINTPSWLRERVPQIRLSGHGSHEGNNYVVPPFEHTKTTPTSECDNDDSYIESKENLSIISRDSDSTSIFLQNATEHVDKSSSTGRIRYGDYRRACSALAAAVKSRNATLSSNSGSSRSNVPHSYDKWLSNRIRHHTGVHKISPSPIPPGGYLHDEQDPFTVQRRYGYGRNISRETSPAPPNFPPPPPPDPIASSTDANLPTDVALPGLNCLPGSAAVGRWSTSTLCDSAYSGNNTPTDSVISNVSNRSFLHSSNNTMRQKVYLGWRSQDNLLDAKSSTFSNDPTQRLAYTYKQGVLSGRASVSGAFSDRSRLSSDDFGGTRSQSYSRSLPRNCFGSQLQHLPNPQQQDQQTDLHESIKSVSSAIMEFCKADDVPLPPPDDQTRLRHIRTKDQHQKSRVVWMESSFVSGKDNTATNGNIQIQVTPTAADTVLHNDPT